MEVIQKTIQAKKESQKEKSFIFYVNPLLFYFKKHLLTIIRHLSHHLFSFSSGLMTIFLNLISLLFNFVKFYDDFKKQSVQKTRRKTLIKAFSSTSVVLLLKKNREEVREPDLVRELFSKPSNEFLTEHFTTQFSNF